MNGPTPWARPGRTGRDPAGILIIAVVGLLILYEVLRSNRISSEEIIFFCVLIPSIILHEVSHGVVALWCGDDTAQRAGRLTLNPLRHVDLIGTLVLPVLLVLTTGSAFGYAKPVPVNVRRLRHPRNQSLLVGLVGPAVNLVLAGLAAAILRFAPNGTVPPSSYIPAGYIPSSVVWQVVFLFGFANIILAAFNLIPIPPLDGSAVIERLLPRAWWPGYLRLRMYALPGLILIVLLFPSVRNGATSFGLRLWGDLVG